MLTSVSVDQSQFIGHSDVIKFIREEIEFAAQSDAKVLITGETGSGKEVVAKLIHQHSKRSFARLVTINCAGVPDSLLESELFGYARGSFTGAYRDKPGLLETAPNGTVFLDEVGEMSTRMQTVLLRFLETGEIQRVGATRPHTRVNVRLITATNRELEGQIASGAFRDDLYFRLNVIRLCVPPLRQRTEDIPALLEYFADLYSRQHHLPRPQFTADAMDVLMRYRWPGNVRELKNVIERIVLKRHTHAVRSMDLPADVFARRSYEAVPPADAIAPRGGVVEQLAKRLFEQGESFWTGVYQEFMSHDLTREHLRQLVRLGLLRTNGNYRALVQLFNLPPGDYRRFLTFLRKHNCHLPFQQFRTTACADGSRYASHSEQRAVGQS